MLIDSSFPPESPFVPSQNPKINKFQPDQTRLNTIQSAMLTNREQTCDIISPSPHRNHIFQTNKPPHSSPMKQTIINTFQNINFMPLIQEKNQNKIIERQRIFKKCNQQCNYTQQLRNETKPLARKHKIFQLGSYKRNDKLQFRQNKEERLFHALDRKQNINRRVQAVNNINSQQLKQSIFVTNHQNRHSSHFKSPNLNLNRVTFNHQSVISHRSLHKQHNNMQNKITFSYMNSAQNPTSMMPVLYGLPQIRSEAAFKPLFPINTQLTQQKRVFNSNITHHSNPASSKIKKINFQYKTPQIDLQTVNTKKLSWGQKIRTQLTQSKKKNSIQKANVYECPVKNGSYKNSQAYSDNMAKKYFQKNQLKQSFSIQSIDGQNSRYFDQDELEDINLMTKRISYRNIDILGDDYAKQHHQVLIDSKQLFVDFQNSHREDQDKNIKKTQKSKFIQKQNPIKNNPTIIVNNQKNKRYFNIDQKMPKILIGFALLLLIVQVIF